MFKRVALAGVLIVAFAAAAGAQDWSAAFKTIDVDNSGRISRIEWESGWPKLKIEPVPTFTAMDTDVNNGIDMDEWATATKMVKAFPVSCKSADSSWCEKQY